ncbi:MAG TPA: acyltransferase [Puia sp.]|nr:acyltransferase [Puia sp.]
MSNREWLLSGCRLSRHLDERKSNNFNWLRLVAALLVLLSHCYGFGHQDPFQRLTNDLVRGSDIAMPVFFFLSGLLVTQSLDHSPSRLNFLWRRVLRLYPAIFLFVALTALVMGPLVTTLPMRDYFADPLFGQYWQTALLVRVYHHLPGVFTTSPHGRLVNVSLWSLPLEIKLYAMLFLIGLLRSRLVLLGAMFAGIAFLLAGMVLYTPVETMLKMVFGPSFLLEPYTRFSVYFLIGVVAYEYRSRIVVYNYWLFLLPLAWLIAAWIPFPEILSLVLLPATVLFAGLKGSRLLSKITPRPDLSYGIYIWGFPVQQLIITNWNIGNDGLVFGLDLVFTLPLALLSWYAVESPALRWKTKRPSSRTASRTKLRI